MKDLTPASHRPPKLRDRRGEFSDFLKLRFFEDAPLKLTVLSDVIMWILLLLAKSLLSKAMNTAVDQSLTISR